MRHNLTDHYQNTSTRPYHYFATIGNAWPTPLIHDSNNCLHTFHQGRAVSHKQSLLWSALVRDAAIRKYKMNNCISATVDICPRDTTLDF